ncbi:dynamin family protein [Pseudomonas guariconensis]|uniref:LeoA/HP0731 family dynamin-like GTPase n=1 Tax=Pseudomonas TaxID=286 RepID=UPI002097F885|nr:MULTISPECIES: LeoA/HP0731 family dynamin-like GTPase [Pseudomonas]MCO7643520.1 dynamin family protein [Pseudomonas sp. S 311-6]MCO7517314.1 dynamin family protein [Pseudomonas putida]MCO7568116.1 dynamin family protein [Pseudomonas mosselii]MCO7605794.1 dynamin family protein [Pseudomonas guariconensis]MCO7619745.1 dynamin family protein [Pseudomonas guariconensis]
MEQFKQFDASKTEVIKSLDNLQKLVGALEALGLDVSQDIDKIKKAIGDVQSDVLRIALLGAFSDGKTSVVAGWLGQVMKDMKIDTNESSDALAIYRPDNLQDRCEIVDTPGLFGDKEKTAENGALVQYGDITKNYISEAHLIFYVVDATNPLKESHQDIVRWVLRDLNKLSSTIFVINKMDEVADLRDTEEFEQQSTIKKNNLLDKLQRFVDLTAAEREAINVVCVASNPNSRGLEFWLEQKDLYDQRSRISELKQVTQHVLDGSGRETLIKKTGIDVVRDVLGKKIAVAQDELIKFKLLADNQRRDSARMQEDIAEGKRKVLATVGNLYEELNNLETDLLNSIRTLPRDQVHAFLEAQIGFSNNDIGEKLRFRIDHLFSTAFNQSSSIMSGISAKIEHQLDSASDFADSITASALSASSRALTAVSKIPVESIKNGVFLARETLKNLTGYVYKFKPWEATKLAANISRWAGPIGAGIQVLTDVISVAQQQRAEAELKQLQNDLAEVVKSHFAEPMTLLKDHDKVMDIFAPQIKAFEKILVEQEASLDNLRNRQAQLEELEAHLSQAFGSQGVIEGEYKVI